MDSIANRKQNPLQQQTSSLETYKIGPLSINAFLVSLQYYKVHFWKRMVSVCLTLSQFTNLVLLFVGLLHDINRFLLFVINVRNQSTKPPKLLVFVASFILCCVVVVVQWIHTFVEGSTTCWLVIVYVWFKICDLWVW